MRFEDVDGEDVERRWRGLDVGEGEVYGYVGVAAACVEDLDGGPWRGGGGYVSVVWGKDFIGCIEEEGGREVVFHGAQGFTDGEG